MPISYYFIGWGLMFGALAASRFAHRALHIVYRGKTKAAQKGKHVMVIGAGDAGQQLLDEMQRSRHLNVNVKCIIDDDPAKQGKYIRDIPVVGGRNDILAAAHKYDVNQIILAVPTLNTKERKQKRCFKPHAYILETFARIFTGFLSIFLKKDVSHPLDFQGNSVIIKKLVQILTSILLALDERARAICP